ncbi:4062_t:CDS:2, partial [Racocetra fulgida]
TKQISAPIMNSRKLEFINAGRLSMIIDFYGPSGCRMLRTVDKVITEIKKAIIDMSNSMRKPDGLQLSVKGPLTVREYHNFDECHESDSKMQNNEDTESNFREFSTPDVITSSNDYLIETSPEILKFWDTHKLTPYDGAKNVKYLVMFPESENLRYYIEYFFDELRVQYEFILISNYLPDLALLPNESELSQQIRSYELACEQLAPFVLPKPSVVSVNFKLTKDPLPLEELVTYDTILQISYGYSCESFSTTVPLTTTKQLFSSAWDKIRKTMGDYRQTIITKVGVITKEEKDRDVTIVSIDIEPALTINPILENKHQKLKHL